MMWPRVFGTLRLSTARTDPSRDVDCACRNVEGLVYVVGRARDSSLFRTWQREFVTSML